ncbi:MAG TPA: hypothetical protein VFY17_11845 [Pilimelia sp.]|nr:hypothetical protein [Pilimelia sp.]
MAPQGWTSSIATAAGVAAGVGAAQLGLGYGLGIVSWQPPADGDRAAVWAGNVTWTVWITATAVIIGALVADRLAWRAADAGAGAGAGAAERTGRGLWRLVLAAAAALGGLSTAVLIAIPARDAPDTGALAPATAAAGYALAGLIVGLAGAAAALRSAAVAANVVASASAVWLLTVVSVVCGALGLGPADTALGSWPLAAGADVWFRGLHVPAVTLSLLGAALIGALGAWLARHASRSGLGAAVSGAAGPLLVAVAYVLAGPRVTGAAASQLSAYLTAPYAVLAGIAGSLAVTAARVAGLSAAGPAPRRRLPPPALTGGPGGVPADPATPPRPRRSGAGGTPVPQGTAADRTGTAAPGRKESAAVTAAAASGPAADSAGTARPSEGDPPPAEGPPADSRARAPRRRAAAGPGVAAKSGTPTAEPEASADSANPAATPAADGPEPAKATRRPRTRRANAAPGEGEDERPAAEAGV